MIDGTPRANVTEGISQEASVTRTSLHLFLIDGKQWGKVTEVEDEVEDEIKDGIKDEVEDKNEVEDEVEDKVEDEIKDEVSLSRCGRESIGLSCKKAVLG